MGWEALGVVPVLHITEHRTSTAITMQHWRGTGTGACAEKDS